MTGWQRGVAAPAKLGAQKNHCPGGNFHGFVRARRTGLAFDEAPLLQVLTLLDTRRSIFYFPGMVETSTPEIMPDIEREEESDPKSDLEPGYLVVCWNDPVNFMEYVTHVFQKVFGWNKQKAEHHMMEVHNQGKSILVRESMEKAEHYVHMLQKYSLHATMEKQE